MVTMHCPVGACRREYETVPMPPSYGYRVPQHRFDYGPGVEAMCPGSGMRLLGNGVLHGDDIKAMDDAMREWVRGMVRHLKDTGRIPAETPRSVSAEEFKLRIIADGGTPMGDEPDRPREEYFPGRPADAPEPGAGEPPAAPIPMDTGGYPLGRAAEMDDARSQLRGITNLVAGQIGTTQDHLAKVTHLMETAEALALEAAAAVQQAMALARAAVGTGAGAPLPAEKMIFELTMARSIVESRSDGIPAAIKLVGDRVTAAHQRLLAARMHAEDYVAQS